METNGSMKAGTAGGLLFVLVNVSSAEIYKTVLLAGIGAVVSFCVSLVLKKVVKRMLRK